MVTGYGRLLAMKDAKGLCGQPNDLGPQPSGTLASLHDADRTEARGL